MDIWWRRIARLAQAKLVYEVRPLAAVADRALGHVAPPPFAMLCQKAENDAYRDCDRVVSMLPKVQVCMKAHKLNLARLHIVPNGFAPEEWEAPGAPLAPELAAHLSAARRGRVVVGYAGSMGLPNALDVLLDAAAQLREARSPSCWVGQGHEAERLAERARSLPNVAFFPAIPRAPDPDPCWASSTSPTSAGSARRSTASASRPTS